MTDYNQNYIKRPSQPSQLFSGIWTRVPGMWDDSSCLYLLPTIELYICILCCATMKHTTPGSVSGIHFPIALTLTLVLCLILTKDSIWPVFNVLSPGCKRCCIFVFWLLCSCIWASFLQKSKTGRKYLRRVGRLLQQKQTARQFMNIYWVPTICQALG